MSDQSRMPGIGRMILLLGTSCGLIVANLYYAQPLTGLIASSLGMTPESVGLIVTLPLLGYGAGLLFIVPLGDLLENRRLVFVMLGLEAICLLLLTVLASPALFLGVAFFVGLTASAVQLLLPYITYIVPEAVRGQAVGKVVSGVMLGIMLARPVSSFVADLWSWQRMFALSALLMIGLLVVLMKSLPERRPSSQFRYGELLGSMIEIALETPIMRRRAIYHACMFGSFSVFWTAVPLWLADPPFGLSQHGIAYIALAGVAGAIAPPIAGRLADGGHSRFGTIVAMILATGAFLLTMLIHSGSRFSLILIALAAIVLDFAVSSNLVFGQRAIFSLGPEQRSRLNGMFMATFFAGGAICAGVSGWAYARFGWIGVSAFGAALPLLSLVYLASEAIGPTSRTVAMSPK